MRKVYLFLDFDGVMVTKFSSFSEFHEGMEFDDKCINTLNQLIKIIRNKYSFSLVISSNWKYELTKSEIKHMLIEIYNIDISENDIHFTKNTGNKYNEINSFIDNLDSKCLVIILEDDPLPRNLNYFQIRTRSEDGIRATDDILNAVDELIKKQ
ncbi:hypothetical protein GCM10011409_44380 [Lentibacillus populi]|uniref:Uncharacterized protein n=1 Tax=Lentibacillus populi TaxID=1827502 RepID=A0A9W5X7P7_9BACI|nr:HAD domain-containing protein [Lentibacillus populi]GGB62309.1 hypothetical protein GCM10011409_44380 [Lentibacillus populi]